MSMYANKQDLDIALEQYNEGFAYGAIKWHEIPADVTPEWLWGYEDIRDIVEEQKKLL